MVKNFKLLSFIVTLFLVVGLFTVPVMGMKAAADEPAAEIPGEETVLEDSGLASAPDSAEPDTDGADANANEPAEGTEADANEPAAETEDELNEAVNVVVRVESSAFEDERTLLPPTEAVLEINKLLSSFQATPLEALEIVTDGDIEITESDIGSFLTGVLGVSDETGAYSWMYAVNGEIPEASVDSYSLNDGDEVVFYFSNWENADYSYFTPEKLTVSEGESFTLNLTAVDFAEGEYPVEGAMLIITSDAPATRELNYTDADGCAELSFFAEGEYLISASKQNDDGISVISRPYCIVTVAGADGNGNESVKTETDSTTGSAIEDSPETDVTENENLPGTDVPGEEPQLLPDIKPMPMPVAPISYDNAAKTLNVYGKDVDITGLRVIFDEAANDLYLPLRAVAEALGAEVNWHTETSMVSINIKSAPSVIQTPDGETVMDEIRMVAFNAKDALALNEIKFIENRIYVPSRFIIDNFGER